MMTAPRSSRAVTLVELLVVMSIITLLASMLVVMATSVTNRMGEARAKAGIQMLSAVLELYHGDCGMYPDAINHDPERHKRAVAIRNLIPWVPEPDGSYPMSGHPDPKAVRKLYRKGRTKVTDETSKNGYRECSELVAALCSTDLGWGNPRFFDHFKDDDLNPVDPLTHNGGQLVDPWRRRYFYMSAVAYRYRNVPSRKPGGGTTTNGLAGGPFHNPETYQIYSAGPNSETYPDDQNRAGTDEDDITNW